MQARARAVRQALAGATLRLGRLRRSGAGPGGAAHVARRAEELRGALARVDLKAQVHGKSLKAKKYLREIELAAAALLEALDALPEPGTPPPGQPGEPAGEFERLYEELVKVLNPPAWALEPHPATAEPLPTDALHSPPSEDRSLPEDGSGEEGGSGDEETSVEVPAGGDSWQAAEEAAAAAADAVARLMVGAGASRDSPPKLEVASPSGQGLSADATSSLAGGGPSVMDLSGPEMSDAAVVGGQVGGLGERPLGVDESDEAPATAAGLREGGADPSVCVSAASPSAGEARSPEVSPGGPRAALRSIAPPHARRGDDTPPDPPGALIAALLEDYDAGMRREWPLGADVASLLDRARAQVALGTPDALRAALRLFREAALMGSLLAARGKALLYLCGADISGEGTCEATRGAAVPGRAVGWGGSQQTLAEKWLRHAAERGDLISARELAKGLDEVGRGAESAQWYRRAADLGCSSSAAEYAFKLEHGARDAAVPGGASSCGTPPLGRDPAAAAQWYGRAAEGGCTWAQSNLARLLCVGEGCDCDPEAGAALFRSAAEAGSEHAANSLGVCFEEGIGVPEDLPEAAAWYRLACERGLLEGALNLGHALAALEDFAGAREAFEIAAHWGSQEALYCQGFLEEERSRSGPPQARDGRAGPAPPPGPGGAGLPSSKALELYRRAASSGDARALVRLAEVAWVHGRVDEALGLYHRAAGAGCPEGFLALGWLAAEGEAGVERDPEVAQECFRRAAGLGHSGALAALSALESAPCRGGKPPQVPRHGVI